MTKPEYTKISHELQDMIQGPGWIRFQDMVVEEVKDEEKAIEKLLDKDGSAKSLTKHFARRKAYKKVMDWVYDEIRRGE